MHFLLTLAREKEALVALLQRERTETQIEQLLHPRIFRKKKRIQVTQALLSLGSPVLTQMPVQIQCSLQNIDPKGQQISHLPGDRCNVKHSVVQQKAKCSRGERHSPFPEQAV